jgi:hypothetical protein
MADEISKPALSGADELALMITEAFDMLPPDHQKWVIMKIAGVPPNYDNPVYQSLQPITPWPYIFPATNVTGGTVNGINDGFLHPFATGLYD